MRIAASICTCLCCLFLVSAANALDTQIRVFGLLAPNADVSVATTSLTMIKKTWENSGNPAGVTIVLVNGGVPVPGRVESWRGNPIEHALSVSGFPPSCPARDVRDPVSISRHITRSVRISRTTRSCTLRLKVYATYHAGAAFNRGRTR